MYKKKLIILYIIFTSNNIIYSLTNLEGKVIFWTSSGTKRLKGSKKISTILIPYTLKIIRSYILSLGYKYIFIKVKGFSKNKKFTLKSLKQFFSNIILINEQTFFPHNGCKSKKIKRL
uniref:ribosomal protein S11 n=1 Tax=Caulacanthus ustulatus TaxID=31411 RepID=UPI0030026BCC|nr:ribosomal protein S11 [Caulacanthus ustulatus]